jgi:hypothetical protein
MPVTFTVVPTNFILLSGPISGYTFQAFGTTGVAISRGLSYTQSPGACPSPCGFNEIELAEIEGGAAVAFVQLLLTSNIRLADPSEGIGTGFTRSQRIIAQLLTLQPSPRLELVDSARFTCYTQQPSVATILSPNLSFQYQGLALNLG